MRIFYVFIFIAFILSFLTMAVVRDIRMERYYSLDLRNRVVGARIIKDGHSPYFYKWNSVDGVRYYEPNNFDSARASSITASPFFHHLFSPFVEAPERKIALWWLVMEYSMLLMTVLLALRLTTTNLQRLLVLFTLTLFLWTAGWIFHVFRGQNYICVPFLAMIFYVCLHRLLTHPLSPVLCAIAGLAAICVVLIKPNTFLFFIPFLWLLRRLNRWQLVFFFLPVILLASWSLTDEQERSLWQDYRKNIAETIWMHQEMNKGIQGNQPDPRMAEWEGIHLGDVEHMYSKDPQMPASGNGNLFLLVERIFHVKLSVAVQLTLSISLILALFILFYARYPVIRSGSRSEAIRHLPAMAILGFCLYMISDLFSPVLRYDYNALQWIFPMLIAACLFQLRIKKYFLLLMAGLLLDILHLPFLRFDHTFGEYLLLAGLLSLCFSLKPTKNGASHPETEYQ